MMKRKVILKVVLHQEQSGRMFQKILNAHYVMLEKISFQKLNKILILFKYGWINQNPGACEQQGFLLRYFVMISQKIIYLLLIM